MPEYIVKENNSILKDHVDYPAGSPIELTEEEAAKIPWAVELPSEQETAPPEDPEAAFAQHVAETSVKNLIDEVMDIEDEDVRMDTAFDIISIETGAENPRKTLIEKLGEIVNPKSPENEDEDE